MLTRNDVAVVGCHRSAAEAVRLLSGLLATLASGDAEAADGDLRQLWTSLHHQGGTIAVGALAVPFLLRIAATARPELRAQTLRLVAEIGRCQHMGDGSREGLLQVAEEPLMIEGSTMCPADWTIQAARQAVTYDLHLLLPLLSDPDPEAELERAPRPGDCVIAVNNKDIRARERDPADLSRSHALLPAVRASGTPCPVSASGIDTPSAAAGLLAAGYRGLLTGTALLRSEDPGVWSAAGPGLLAERRVPSRVACSQA